MSEIEQYLEDLNRVKSQWRAHWVLPYGSTYCKAYTEFTKTLDDQKKSDAVKAQIAVMVLSMAVGGPICAMMGKSAVSSSTFDAAVKLATDKQWTRTVNLLKAAGKSPVAEYVAGQAWGTASAVLTDKAKQQVEGVISKSTPAGEFIKLSQKQLVDEPQIAQNKLERYLELVYIAAHLIGEGIRESTKLTSAEKDEAAAQLRKAPFFRDAPTSNLIQSAGAGLDPQLDMELAMYMILVMNCDFKVTGSASVSGGVAVSHSEKKRSVNVPTGSSKYPTASSRVVKTYSPFMPEWSIFVSGMTRYYTEIRYDQLGSKIMARVGKLYKRHYNNDFKVGALDGNEVWRAERCFDWVGEKYQNSYKKQMKTN